MKRRNQWRNGQRYSGWRRHQPSATTAATACSRPGHGQEWIRVGNDYLLVGIASGIIFGAIAAQLSGSSRTERWKGGSQGPPFLLCPCGNRVWTALGVRRSCLRGHDLYGRETSSLNALSACLPRRDTRPRADFIGDRRSASRGTARRPTRRAATIWACCPFHGEKIAVLPLRGQEGPLPLFRLRRCRATISSS